MRVIWVTYILITVGVTVDWFVCVCSCVVDICYDIQPSFSSSLSGLHPSLSPLQKVLNHFNMKAVKCLQQSLWWNWEHLKRLHPSQLFIHSFHHPFMIFHPLLVPDPLHWFSFAIHYLSSLFLLAPDWLFILVFSFWVLSTATCQF